MLYDSFLCLYIKNQKWEPNTQVYCGNMWFNFAFPMYYSTVKLMVKTYSHNSLYADLQQSNSHSTSFVYFFAPINN